MITKFEAIGIAACLGIMVAALFLLRVDSASKTLATPDINTQAAAVVVSTDAEDQDQARLAAVTEAMGAGGKQEKLIIDDISFGNGQEAKEGDTVKVNYIGRLQNGQEFDNSFKRGEPIEFTLGKGEVIAGWEEGIKGMKVGGERVLVVPPQYGYGNRSVGPIPAGATLVFAVELMEIVE